MRVIDDLLESAERLQVGDHLLAGLFHGQARVPLAGLSDAAVRADRLDRVQAVLAADVEVGDVVRRRDLQGAGAEVGLHALVGDDRQLAPQQRQHGRATDDGPVALVLGVHGHGRVAQHGLGAGGGDGDRPAPDQVVAHLVELAGRLHVRHFQVADGAAATRAPVDQVVVLVDVALVVEGDEDLVDGLDVALVEGEALAVVVAGATQAFQLPDDRAAVLLLPLPGAAHELLTAQVLLRESLGAQLLLHHVLGGDAGVVHADQPAGVVALHAMPARENVLDGAVEGVAHVQVAGHVGRRDDDGVGRALGVWLDVEEVAGEPHLRPAGLDGRRLEARAFLERRLAAALTAFLSHGVLRPCRPADDTVRVERRTDTAFTAYIPSIGPIPPSRPRRGLAQHDSAHCAPCADWSLPDL